MRGAGGRRAAGPQRVHDRGRQTPSPASPHGGSPVGSLDNASARQPGEQRALPRPPGCRRTSHTSSVRHLSSRGRVWGAVHIARRAASGPFQPGTTSTALARRRRRDRAGDPRVAALRRGAPGDGVEAPGLVVLGPGDEVELITPPARELLARSAPRRLRREGADAHRRPRGVRPRRGQAPERPTSSRFPRTTAGSPSTPLCPRPRRRPRRDRPRAGRRRAVGDSPRLEAFGATPASGRSPRCWPAAVPGGDGRSARPIAAHRRGPRQDLYQKVGVASRQELVARVFLDEYLPEVATDAARRRAGASRRPTRRRARRRRRRGRLADRARRRGPARS